MTPTDRSTRKPRVLPILSPAAPVRHEEPETPAAPEPQTMREIPRSQLGRIRALVTYGMTVAQVAKVCGVAADEIAREVSTPPAHHRRRSLSELQPVLSAHSGRRKALSS